jgi:hypothetical protein
MPLVNAPNSTVRPTWKDALRAPSASPMHRAPGHAAQDPSTRGHLTKRTIKHAKS